ncbi:hypothetical protein CT0861_01948 [Colletotrichum tofieldiae]|uniref:Uncharacterized protein n=1 Tax=Colletotrichum tofieldiae TaxID=708197 RepID=A0A166SMZ0_9PEZI|nr:hypothetical protein CT0861_01948 [Colletotrichum tofieldiae]
MESSAQIYIADLPRAGDLTDGTRGSRPTTPVPSKGSPPSDSSVATLNLQIQRLEQTLAALAKEHKALDREAANRCHAGLEVADGLIVASAQRGIKGTLWHMCHPSKYSKKRDLLRRHVGIAQHTYETVGRQYQDVARPLAELCERAENIGDDAKQVSDSIHELSSLQQCKEKALDAEIRARLQAWSYKTLRLAALRKRERETGARGECLGIQRTAMDGRHGLMAREDVAGTGLSLKHNWEVRSSLAQEIRRVASEVEMLKANIESLQRGRDALNKAEGLLVVKLVVRVKVFQAKLSRLIAGLQDKERPLRAASDRCLCIAARLDTLKESNFGDLVFGVQDLASSVAVKKGEKKKCSKARKSAGEAPCVHHQPSCAAVEGFGTLKGRRK